MIVKYSDENKSIQSTASYTVTDASRDRASSLVFVRQPSQHEFEIG